MLVLRIAGLTAPILLAAILSSALVPAQLGRILVPMMIVVFLVAGILLLSLRKSRSGWMITGVILSLLLTVPTALFADSVMLNLWGKQITATVVEHRTVWNGKQPDTHNYKLANVSGELVRRKPGLLVGNKVTVIHDPHGFANPMEPGRVESEQGAGVWLGMGWLLLCLTAVPAASRRQRGTT